MKQIILTISFIVAVLTLNAGNGNPPCDCNTNDNITTMQAPGIASWVSSTQIKCTGETDVCWSLTYSGKWVLTIYTEPVVIFDNHDAIDDPPVGPLEVERKENYVVYEVDENVWKIR